jgi:heme exporter protein B
MQLTAVVRKDVLLQWRSPGQRVAILAFGVTVLLLLSFAAGPNTGALRPLASGFLWLALLLSSTLALADSFQTEMEQHALEGLLLLPVSARAIYYGKALANWCQLLMLALLLVPCAVVLYDVTITRVLALSGVLVLGTAGLSAPGTFYAAMAEQAKAKQVLLPLLLFPLVVPVLLASVKATALLVTGDPMRQVGSWAALLASFDLVYWSLCGLLFNRVVEH